MNNLEIYLADKQGELFILAKEKGYDPISFITAYMKSNLIKAIDSDYSYWQLQPVSSWLEAITLTENIRKVDTFYSNETLYWLGYFYRMWHFISGEPSFKIIRYLPPIKGLENYHNYHQIDYINAIEQAKNKYNLERNNHRKYEINKSKANKEIKKDINDKNNIYKDPIYFQYLARRMLYKLLNDESIKRAIHKIDDNKYDFISDNHKYGIKGDVIFKDSRDTIDDRFNNVNNHYSLKVVNHSIYFCFLFSGQYERLEKNDFINTIKDFRNKYLNRNYDYIYFYKLGTLIEINESNEIHIYYMPLSIRERTSIKKEIEIDKVYEEIESHIEG